MKLLFFMIILSIILAYAFSEIEFAPTKLIDRGWNYSAPTKTH